MSRPQKIALASAALLVTLGFAAYVARQPMDFRVYYFGAAGVFDGTRPVYGVNSGMGWPMHYRYPPPFLFIAQPFTQLSMPWAAAIWTILRGVSLILLIRALWDRLGKTASVAAWLVPLLLAGPYVIEDLRYGNAQSLIFALTGAALLLVATAPFLAAMALAAGIVIKVWPLFFLPYLAVRREWRVVAWTVVLTAAFLLLPALHFGLGGNFDLLAQWARQEFSTQTGQAEIWFPSQSLRGVMMRFLTVIDYSQVPDSNYPLVHVLALDPRAIRLIWMVLAGGAYAGLLAITAAKKTLMFGLSEALAFTGVVLLQPFSQKYALVVLLWPAIVAGRIFVSSRVRWMIIAAIVLAAGQPLVSGSSGQRLLQALGFDFLATALLAAFLLVAAFSPATERSS